jgi:hypothetical protein
MNTQFLTKFAKLPRLLVAALIAILVTACATVQTDSDPRVNIHNYHSYQLDYTGNTNATAFNNPLNAKRLREAIESNLASRGLHAAAEGDTADCIVSIATGSRQVVENEPTAPRIGIGWGWYGRGFAGSMAWDNDVHAYNEHRITIDLIDAKSKEPVWHASINENINEGSGTSAEARIRNVVAQLFAKFP